MKKTFLFFFAILFSQFLTAQELLFDVTVNTPKIQNVAKEVFDDLEKSVEEFMNNRKWTEDVYEPEERIRCKIQLTINEEISLTSFKASIAIQSTRPIFGSSEETQLLNHVDKDVTFNYEQFQPMVFSKNIFQNNLTSILGFYAYVILGLDYDSFSPLGGDSYYQTAQDIVNNVPQNLTGTFKGWRQLDGNRNRYWIIENLTSPKFRDFREGMYKYHRQGLDIMAEDSGKGRAAILETINIIQSVNRNAPNGMILQMFANSKRKELIEIVKAGDRAQKDKFIKVMVRVDASNANEYSKIGRF